MKRIIVLLSALILIILLYGMAMAGAPASNVNVVNTPTVNVTNTVPIRSQAATQLLKTTEFHILSNPTYPPIVPLTPTPIDVSSCGSLQFFASAEPWIQCRFTDAFSYFTSDWLPSSGSSPSVTFSIPTPIIQISLECMFGSTSIYGYDLYVALYCR